MSAVPSVLPLRTAVASSAVALTIRVLVDRYLADRRAQHRAGAIGDDYLRRLVDHLEDLARAHGALPVAELRPSIGRQWLCTHERWRSPHTLENAYRSVRGLMRWAEDEELIDRNPLRSMRRFWPPPQPRGACRPEEYEALMQAARNADGKRGRKRPARTRFRFQLWFLWHSGCRTCELREARWEHIDWTRGLLVLPKSKTLRATGAARVVPLSENVVRVLRFLKRHRLPNQTHIFCARGGKKIDRKSWNRLFRKYARLAGVREGLTLYTLRHGFCVEALEEGLGDQELAEIMGHTTTRYIRWYGRDLREKTEHLRRAAGRVHRRRKRHPEQGELFDGID